MDVIFYIAFAVAAVSISGNSLASAELEDGADVEEDICYGYHANKLYCTCRPSDVDVRDVNCFVLSDFPSSDPLWRSFASMTKLEHLEFQSQGVSTLKYVPRQALMPSVGNLETLVIKHASLGSVPAYVFLNATALTTIDLANNEIVELERRCFAHLPVLKELTLSENQLTVVRRSTFVGLTKLSVLLLDRNRISLIEDSTFEDLTALQELSLMKNDLSRLSMGMFRGLSSLKRLELGINRIGHLGPGIFSDLTLVQEINLRENVLTAINPEAFVGLDNLLVLYLNRNRLIGISDATFRPLRALRYLDLRHNRLATLSEDAVASLDLRNSNITHLYISDNKFACDCRIEWMLEIAKSKSHDDLSQWNQVECQLPVVSPAIISTTTERAEEIRKKMVADDANVADNRPMTMNDNPVDKSSAASDDDDAAAGRKFVFLMKASQYLETGSGKACPLSSPPAKSDLISERPSGHLDASTVSRSSVVSHHDRSVLSFASLMIVTIIIIIIASN